MHREPHQFICAFVPGLKRSVSTEPGLPIPGSSFSAWAPQPSLEFVRLGLQPSLEFVFGVNAGCCSSVQKVAGTLSMTLWCEIEEPLIEEQLLDGQLVEEP